LIGVCIDDNNWCQAPSFDLLLGPEACFRLMSVRIVRLGSDRIPEEGVRIGTVRRPPRGVPKSDYAKRNFYDAWLPSLAPSEALLKSARSASTDDKRAWKTFVRKYRAEMKTPDARALLATLAALSHHSNFSVGCYCADEARCHRSVLRELLVEYGADVES
jgi:uncharacterized protein YeaO (DUF488 family)